MLWLWKRSPHRNKKISPSQNLVNVDNFMVGTIKWGLLLSLYKSFSFKIGQDLMLHSKFLPCRWSEWHWETEWRRWKKGIQGKPWTFSLNIDGKEREGSLWGRQYRSPPTPWWKKWCSINSKGFLRCVSHHVFCELGFGSQVFSSLSYIDWTTTWTWAFWYFSMSISFLVIACQ